MVRMAGAEVAAGVAGQIRQAARGPADYPAVGDWVVVEHDPGGAATIRAILDRRGAMVRTARDAARRGRAGPHDEQVLAANVDVAFVVDSFGAGPNLRRLERYLALAWSAAARPVVILNKADLAGAGGTGDSAAAVEAIAPGVRVLCTTVLAGDGVAAIRREIGPGQTAVVVGPSGAGKSTIVNALLGEARQATGVVRADDRRGRHTTTARELFELPGGGLIVDTPGIRSLELAADDGALEQAFTEIAALALDCRFADCRHDGEPGCAVALAIANGRLSAERLANARQLATESRERSSALSDRAAKKQRDKAFGRALRQQYRLRERDPRDA
jgi:ribosome biogenesis GTPase